MIKILKVIYHNKVGISYQWIARTSIMTTINTIFKEYFVNLVQIIPKIKPSQSRKIKMIKMMTKIYNTKKNKQRSLVVKIFQ